jgi:dipeptide transport system substrate-binding protein
MDGVEDTITTDPAIILNQFKAGKLDYMVPNGLNIGDIKAAIPKVQIFPHAFPGGFTGWWALSSVSDPTNKAPWTDRRVRQAMSMALDRDSMVAAVYNLDLFQKAGFKFSVPWQALLPASYGPIAIQPQDVPALKTLYSYDPKAAKALLDQAGVGSGFDLDVWAVAGVAYGPEYDTITQLSMKYWNDIGIRTTLHPQDYRSDFIPNTYQGKLFTGSRGVGHAGQAGLSEPAVFLQSVFAPGAPVNQSKVNDPAVQPALDKYFAEPDPAKRRQILQDLQMHLIPEMYYISSTWGSFPAIDAFQPNLHGFADHVSFGYAAPAQDITYYWKD